MKLDIKMKPARMILSGLGCRLQRKKKDETLHYDLAISKLISFIFMYVKSHL